MEAFAFHEELVARHDQSSRSFSDIRADDVARDVTVSTGVAAGQAVY